MRSFTFIAILAMTIVLPNQSLSAVTNPPLYTPGKPYTIHGDVAGGGVVELFLTDIRLFRLNHIPIILEGYCNSACTLYTALLRDNLLCARPGTVLGFHEFVEAADRTLEGNVLASYRVVAPTRGYKLRRILSYYPDHILKAINDAGGFPPHNGPLLKIPARKLGIPTC